QTPPHQYHHMNQISPRRLRNVSRKVVTRSRVDRALHSFPTRRSSDLVPPAALTSATTSWKTTSINGSNPAVGSSSRKTSTSEARDRKSTRLNSSHVKISYAVFCVKKKKIIRLIIHCQR